VSDLSCVQGNSASQPPDWLDRLRDHRTIVEVMSGGVR
jgi:hypothetical protein